MKAGKTREELENNLIEPTLTVKRRRNATQKIKENLLENHKIIGGNIQSIINNPKKELSKLDWRILLLFAEQVYLELEIPETNPKDFYTGIEIQKARQYTGKLTVEGDISLPLTFEEVIEIDYDQYVTKVDVKTLAQMSSLLLNYNFDIQRESKRKIIGGETIQEATLVMENVEEMKNHLKRDTLETTNIVINASAGTSHKGNELAYDPETKRLTINEGTVLDIVDGYHRCKASELAVNEDPNIEFSFIVLILNYTDDQAMKYQGQLAKATPIAKPRQKQLAESRHADAIVNTLNTRSELANRISLNPRPSSKHKELVSYDLMADTINKEFSLDRVFEVQLISKYLVKFFDVLIGYYEEQFTNNLLQNRKESLMTDNNMFVGYLILAKRMYEANKDSIDLIGYIDKIDFSKDNQLWSELEILDKKQKLNDTLTVRNNIKKYFESIPID